MHVSIVSCLNKALYHGVIYMKHGTQTFDDLHPRGCFWRIQECICLESNTLWIDPLSPLKCQNDLGR